MKPIHLIMLCIMTGCASYGQEITKHEDKPLIDTSVFGKWPGVGGASLSNDGKYIAYGIDKVPVNSHTLVIKSMVSSWTRSVTGANECEFTSDSRRAMISLGGDSLLVCTLGTNQQEYIAPAARHVLSTFKQEDWLAFLVHEPTKKLVLRSLVTGKEKQFEQVDDFLFSDSRNKLLMYTTMQQDNRVIHRLQCLDMQDGKLDTLWQGERNAIKYTFSPSGAEIAFFVIGPPGGASKTELWICRAGEAKTMPLVSEARMAVDTNLIISKEQLVFSQDGGRIFFKLEEKNLPEAKSGAVKVDVWNYKDGRLQSDQLGDLGPRLYAAVLNTHDGRWLRLQQEQDALLEDPDQFNEEVKLMMKFGKEDGVDGAEWVWNENARPSIYLVDTRDGSRKLVKKQMLNFSMFAISPDGRWLVYFDQEQQAYCSFDRKSGITRNLTKKTPVRWVNVNQFDGSGYSTTTPTPGLLKPPYLAVGISDWQKDGTILAYDEYDIWRLDPAGIRPPRNLTNGYGRKNHIRFRLVKVYESGRDRQVVNKEKWILQAFNTETKYSGLYQVAPDGKGDPESLVMGPWSMHLTMKAKDAETWVIQRESAVEPVNLFMTHDLKSYTPVSDFQPQKEYNWLTAVLLHYPSPDGTDGAGVLYKPENFDPHKKYPVLFNYYEKRSDEMYLFPTPDYVRTNIDIPYFVSRGYLVFVPDIHYKMGSAAESITHCIEWAAKYLGKLPYVDAKRMGIEGQSFGGYETNVLVTHTHLFAAAAEMAGPSDWITMYGGVRFGNGTFLGSSIQSFVETSQPRIGANLWQRPDLFIKNSPIFQADKVTTPLLMIHSIGDDNVKFEQSLEFYIDLRRMGKKVWMLQYDDESHIVGHENDAMDLTIRLTQFFDYYLKDAPPPRWMTVGIPARRKGVDTGLELDLSGNKP